MFGLLLAISGACPPNKTISCAAGELQVVCMDKNEIAGHLHLYVELLVVKKISQVVFISQNVVQLFQILQNTIMCRYRILSTD